VNENIKAFVKHNYVTDSESRIKWQLYGVMTMLFAFSYAIYTFYNNGNRRVDISLLVFSMLFLIIIIVLRYKVNLLSDNTRFVRQQIIYNLGLWITSDVCITYVAYKVFGIKIAFIGIVYHTMLILSVFYMTFRKQSIWIRTGAYKDYSEEVAKWDRWHTKIWHKDNYSSAVFFGICILLKWISKTGVLLIFLLFSVKVFFIIDLVKYYMQLKYAKKYGLQDLLPSAPNKELTP
jgi:membrane protein